MQRGIVVAERRLILGGGTINVLKRRRRTSENTMANTYTALHYHFVFSTKGRYPWIKQEIEERIWKYLGGIARANKMKPLKIGGIEDHIHILIGAPPTIAPAKIAQLLKGGSSAWIHDTFPELSDFAWQDGYGAFTVSKSVIADLTEYIANQREHHLTRTVSFFSKQPRPDLTR